MPGSPDQLAAAIAALEQQRAVLGDAIVEVALAPLRRELAALQAAQTTAHQQLKQVSVLFVDVVGSTSIGQQLTPEDIHAVMDGALERFTAVVQSQRGRVLQYTGDGMLAAFGSEETHEDDVESAIRAGLGIIVEAKAMAPEVRLQHGVPDFNVRAGVHTGTVLLGGGVDADGSIRGATVNVAARMEQSAPPGRLRISADSYRHVRGLFEVTEQEPIQVKGVAEPLRSFLVDRAKPRAFRVPNRGIEGLQTPMVGRQAEFERLCIAFVDAATENRGRAITIVAEAGLGKSRLVAEFRQTIDPESCWLLLGRAHPRSALHPYGMLYDMLARQFRIHDQDAPDDARRKIVEGLAPLVAPGDEADVHLLGQLIGIDFSASPHVADLLGDDARFKEQAFAAAERVLRRLCQAMPVVMVLDDLHWADGGTLEFVGRLLPNSQDMPLLCLMTTRPTFLDVQPEWVTPPDRHERLDLKPLDAALSHDLAGALLQRMADAPDSLRRMITTGAEGNPFYMEELVKMLVDDGVIDVAGDTWRVVPDKLLRTHVPSTLAGVLQARLDALTLRERTALQQAAVVGHVFWEPALQAVDAAALEMLPALLRKRMIVRHDSADGEQGREYAFQHNLLHQATYDGVLKAPRLDAHAKAGAYWRTRAEVASARDVNAASSRALAETQYHLCKVDAPGYLAWFEPQFDIYLHAYAGSALRPLMEQLVEVCDQRFGADHAETAKALTNTARALLLLGAGAEAEQALQRAIRIQQAIPGDHPDKARTLAVMGGYHSGRGDLAAAEPFFRQALGMRTATLGAEHPLTLDTLDYLAKVLLELGQLDEAERMFRRVLEAKERLFGDVSPDTAFAQTALGEVLYKLGRQAEAEALIRRALEVQQVQLGADNPETAMSMWHLAEALRGQGRIEDAENNGQLALETLEAKLGPEHEWTAWGLKGLAETRLAARRADDAAALAGRAAAAFEKVYGPSHPVLGTTLALMGRAFIDSDRRSEARQCLLRAGDILAAAGPRCEAQARSARELLIAIDRAEARS